MLLFRQSTRACVTSPCFLSIHRASSRGSSFQVGCPGYGPRLDSVRHSSQRATSPRAESIHPSIDNLATIPEETRQRIQAEYLLPILDVMRREFGMEVVNRVVQKSLGTWPLHLEAKAQLESSLDRNIPMLDQARIQVKAVVPLIKEAEKAFGSERVIKAVQTAVRSFGMLLGSTIAAKETGTSVEKMAAAFPVFTDQGGTCSYSVLRRTPERYDVNVTRCQYAQLFKSIGEARLGSQLFCAADFAMVDGIGGDIELKRTKTIMKGDDYCDFRYFSKK